MATAAAKHRSITGWLATPRGPAFAPARDRRIYVLWIALIWAGMIAGFVPDLARYMAEKPAPPWILHLHGIVYFIWLALVTAQIALVEARRVALHRQLGWWLVGLSVTIVVLGLVAAMVDMARSVAHPPFTPEFLGLEFQELAVFSVLLWLAVEMRRDLAAHKRLMVLVAVSIMDPGTARVWSLVSADRPIAPLGWWFSFFWGNATMVVAMMAWDLWRHRRIHPALIGGGALLAAGEASAVWLNYAPWWHIAAGRLVMAWGWAG